LYHSDSLLGFIEGNADYEVPVFAYNTADALSAGGLLGFSDDNWRDGTQSFVFDFLSAFLRSIGYGFSITTIHEVGHHLGMSHPHDGYDDQVNIISVPPTSSIRLGRRRIEHGDRLPGLERRLQPIRSRQHEPVYDRGLH
jgi:hypothetical protein